MPPKDLVRSMKAYARSLDNAIEQVDYVLTRIPTEGVKAAPRALLLELEEVKVQLKAKFERLDTNYDIQSVEVEDDAEDAH